MPQLLKHLHGQTNKLENKIATRWVAWFICKASWWGSQITTSEEYNLRTNALVSK